MLECIQNVTVHLHCTVRQALFYTRHAYPEKEIARSIGELATFRSAIEVFLGILVVQAHFLRPRRGAHLLREDLVRDFRDGLRWILFHRRRHGLAGGEELVYRVGGHCACWAGGGGGISLRDGEFSEGARPLVVLRIVAATNKTDLPTGGGDDS